MAFSESILNAVTTVTDKNELIGKINLDFKIPVFARITAIYALNLFGYIIVIISLVYFGKLTYLDQITLILIPYIAMYILSLSLGLFLAALQVFIKDTLLIVSTLLAMWFFLTPIVYSEFVFPEEYRTILYLNPLYTPISFSHLSVLEDYDLPWLGMSVFIIIVAISLYLSIKLFDKLSSSFEDFK